MKKFNAGETVVTMHNGQIREVVIEQTNTYETVNSCYTNYQVLGIGVNQYEARMKTAKDLFATKRELLGSL